MIRGKYFQRLDHVQPKLVVGVRGLGGSNHLGELAVLVVASEAKEEISKSYIKMKYYRIENICFVIILFILKVS